MSTDELDAGSTGGDLGRLRHELLGDLDPMQLSLPDLCRRCAAVSSVSGVGLQLTANAFAGAVAASDSTTQQIEDLQFILGQGPVVDAIGSGTEVLIEDLEKAAERWPEFAPEAIKIGFRSVFSLPLRVSHRVGSLTFYHTDPGEPDPVVAMRMRRLARLVTSIVLNYPTETSEGGLGRSVRDAAVRRDQLNQAIGIASVELECSQTDALARLRAHTYASAAPLDEVVEAVIEHRLRFER